MELRGYDPEAVMGMVHHIYWHPYDEFAPGGVHSLQQHALTLVVAEKYQITGLQAVICNKIKSRIASEDYNQDDFGGSRASCLLRDKTG